MQIRIALEFPAPWPDNPYSLPLRAIHFLRKQGVIGNTGICFFYEWIWPIPMMPHLNGRVKTVYTWVHQVRLGVRNRHAASVSHSTLADMIAPLFVIFCVVLGKSAGVGPPDSPLYRVLKFLPSRVAPGGCRDALIHYLYSLDRGGDWALSCKYLMSLVNCLRFGLVCGSSQV